MRFMDAGPHRVAGFDCFVSRSGYTGEDGFEISVPADRAEDLAKQLLADGERAADRARRTRQPAAGSRTLPLWPRHRYHDDAGRSCAGMVGAEEPAQGWRSRRRLSRRGPDPRAVRVRCAAPSRRIEARGPRARARGRAAVFRCASTEPIGTVTSGGFGPSLNAPVAMGYLPTALAAVGTQVFAEVRSQRLPCRVSATPFVPNTYKR